MYANESPLSANVIYSIFRNYHYPWKKSKGGKNFANTAGGKKKINLIFWEVSFFFFLKHFHFCWGVGRSQGFCFLSRALIFLLKTNLNSILVGGNQGVVLFYIFSQPLVEFHENGLYAIILLLRIFLIKGF